MTLLLKQWSCVLWRANEIRGFLGAAYYPPQLKEKRDHFKWPEYQAFLRG